MWECLSLAEQCYFLHSELSDHCSEDLEWRFSFADEGLFLGISRQQVQKLVITWTKVLGDGVLTTNGWPNLLSDIQVNWVLDYVTLCDKNLEPLTQMDLLQWINSTFGLSMTWPWLRSFITSQKMLCLVDSEHLEEVRTKLTNQQLKENLDILIAKLQVSHPELVVNMDETSLDSK